MPMPESLSARSIPGTSDPSPSPPSSGSIASLHHLQVVDDPLESDKEEPLRDDTRLLGRVLGEVIAATRGAEVFDIVEATRQAAVGYRRAEAIDREVNVQALDAQLHALPIERVL